MGYPERIVPDETEPGVVAIHLRRYEFALPWCEGRDVLDVACGVGYGAAHLARVARSVVAGDIDEESIEYAAGRYASANVAYRVLDATALPFDGATFDTVCSFETIEHLPDRDTYLREVARVLRDDGTYIVSTPRVETTTDRPDNPFHCVEYARADFEQLLRRFFGEVAMYGQRRVETRRHRLLRRLDVLGLRRRLTVVRRASILTGTAATAEVTLAGVAIDADDVDRATELVAVCTRPLR